MIRALLYRALKALLFHLIDRKLRESLPLAFEVLDGQINRATLVQSPSIAAAGVDAAVRIATGQKVATELQVEQLVDLFDPVAFLKAVSPKSVQR